MLVPILQKYLAQLFLTIVIIPRIYRYLSTSSGTNSTSLADIVKPMLEVFPKHVIFPITGRIGPIGAESTNQADNPIGSLQCLIPVTFQLERRFDKTFPRLRASEHIACCLSNQRRALIVLIKRHDKIAWWIAVFGAELVKPLYRLTENLPVEII